MPLFEYGLRDNPKSKELFGLEALGGKKWKAISFFCGCGGMDLGFLGGFQSLDRLYKPLPFEISSAFDIDERAIETYQLNLGGAAEVCDLSKTEFGNYPQADVLLGGFPCQDFSSSGHKKGFDGKSGQLYKVMVDYMKQKRPQIVVGENVPLLAGMKGGYYINTIVKELEDVGYRVKCWKINCPDYGLPASRKRIFIMCVREDMQGFPKIPKPTHLFEQYTIDQAISDLIAVEDETITNQSQYFVASKATGGAGQGDHKSKRGELGYAVRANAKARIHFHYELDRRLTVRECARLQAFPDEFVFPFAAMTNMTQIGNAVPPIVAHHVANSVAEFLDLQESARVRPRHSVQIDAKNVGAVGDAA